MTKVRCPNCGVYHEIDGPKKDTFENRVKRQVYKTDAMAGTFPQPYRETPVGLPSRETHLDLPLKQAYAFARLDAPIGFVIGAIGGGLFAVVLDVVMVNIRDASLSGWGYAGIIGLVGIGGGTIAFCRTARDRFPIRLDFYDNLLWVEELIGVDLNGDEEIGKPEPKTLRIELQDQSGRPRLIADLETDQQMFVEFARLVLVLKMGFCEATAKKAGYSRKEWEKIRDQFVELAAAAWIDSDHHQQGIRLNENGWNLLKKALPSSLPAGDASKSTPGTNGRTQTNDLTNRYDHIQGAK